MNANDGTLFAPLIRWHIHQYRILFLNLPAFQLSRGDKQWMEQCMDLFMTFTNAMDQILGKLFISISGMQCVFHAFWSINYYFHVWERVKEQNEHIISMRIFIQLIDSVSSWFIALAHAIAIWMSRCHHIPIDISYHLEYFRQFVYICSGSLQQIVATAVKPEPETWEWKKNIYIYCTLKTPNWPIEVNVKAIMPNDTVGCISCAATASTATTRTAHWNIYINPFGIWHFVGKQYYIRMCSFSYIINYIFIHLYCSGHSQVHRSHKFRSYHTKIIWH